MRWLTGLVLAQNLLDMLLFKQFNPAVLGSCLSVRLPHLRASVPAGSRAGTQNRWLHMHINVKIEARSLSRWDGSDLLLCCCDVACCCVAVMPLVMLPSCLCFHPAYLVFTPSCFYPDRIHTYTHKHTQVHISLGFVNICVCVHMYVQGMARGQHSH